MAVLTKDPCQLQFLPSIDFGKKNYTSRPGCSKLMTLFNVSLQFQMLISVMPIFVVGKI